MSASGPGGANDGQGHSSLGAEAGGLRTGRHYGSGGSGERGHVGGVSRGWERSAYAVSASCERYITCESSPGSSAIT